jgi:hypothetical protein
MTIVAEDLRDSLALGGVWEERGGSYWTIPESASPRAMAGAMLAHGGRFITITATQLPDDGGIHLDYHWDLEGKVFTFTFLPAGSSIASIYDLCEAANWIEREVHEYFAVEFAGRECEPLFLRPGQEAGLNLREEDE